MIQLRRTAQIIAPFLFGDAAPPLYWIDSCRYFGASERIGAERVATSSRE